ncbi:MAG: hypothetical protein D6722_28595 [Bacteroidetes bacterium]|nr:MAG: hypothetical protein D6722_28595 [Bacteroidota bacterium]
MKRILYPALLLLLALGCQEAPHHVTTAFYHWKTRCAPSPYERAYLDSLAVDRLYVRFFDVDWNAARGEAVPLASVRLDSAALQGLEIVPTVYLTNRTLTHIAEEEVPTLAERILSRIRGLAGTLPYAEVQLDCDWSAHSRDRFFRLADALRAALAEEGVSLSATIRLHQVRYFEQTGIPPVDRGMLMFYNMGEVRAPDTDNSILDLSTAAPYLDKARQYPLPLDLALPVFSWGVVLRDSLAVHLMSTLRLEQLNDPERFAPLDSQRVQVRHSTYLNGYYLYQGDIIRWESVRPDALDEAAHWLADNLPYDSLRVTFYHLDSALSRRFPAARLQEMIEAFR